MNQKEIISKLVKIYTQEESLAEEAKEIKAAAKEAGFDAAVLSSVAKAIVKNAVDKLIEKSELTLSSIEISRS